MSGKCEFSETECKIIKTQIERRSKYRLEYLKMRTDPCKHSRESGYVFDPAIQKFVSMKTCQFDHFRATPKTSMSGLLLIVLPMVAYGSFMYKERSKFLKDCRCGILRYRERRHKLQ